MLKKFMPVLAASLLALPPAAALAQSAKIAPTAWTSIAQLPDFWSGSWEISKGALGAGGSYTLTPAARELLAKSKSDVNLADFSHCNPMGMPRIMTLGGMPFKFMAMPGLITIWAESSGSLRFVRMDGRKIDPDPDPTFLGASVGHWEGDTLVVDSRGFVDDIKISIGAKPGQGGTAAGPAVGGPASGGPASGEPAAGGPPAANGGNPTGLGAGGPTEPPPAPQVYVAHGPDMRVVERIHLIDNDRLEIDTDTYDDTLYVKPHRTVAIYTRKFGDNADPREWFCSNNVTDKDPT